MADSVQFNRAASLLLVGSGEKGLDLSKMRFTFKTVQCDEESPNNAEIRIYNLKPETVKNIKAEYQRVVLQAGYETAIGVIFDGTIKQFREGKESNIDSYIDILVADGDLAYNWAVVNKTLEVGTTSQERVLAALDAMKAQGATEGYLAPFTGGALPRGKVLFGLARGIMRAETENLGATWNIENGAVNIVPLSGYKPGTAVVLNAATGLIGRPEQTDNGVQVRCLLNPRITVGNLIKIDNKAVNLTINAKGTPAGTTYNSYTAIQNLASITTDGLYRVYVAEHHGDTWGNDWFTDIVALAIDTDTMKVREP